MLTLKRHADARIESLARTRLFEGLDRRSLRLVAARTTGVDVATGKALCEVGGPPDAMFVIEQGQVTLSNGVILGDGDFFGEVALATGTGRTAAAVATAPTRLLVLSPQEFADVQGADRRVADRIAVALRDRARPPAD